MSHSRLQAFILSAAILCALASCARHASPLAVTPEKAAYSAVRPAPAPTSVPSTDWEKRAWIDRVAKLLRAGRGLDPQDARESPAALALLEKGEIIDLLLADSLLGDAVLGFDLYFLGAKPDEVASPSHDRYSALIYDFPQAIAGAQQILEGGDYFKLFDYKQPLFQGVLDHPRSKDPADKGQPDSVVRKKMFGIFQGRFRALITQAQQTPQPALSELCQKTIDTINGQPNFFNAGVPQILFGSGGIYSEVWQGKLFTICGAMDKYTTADWLAALQISVQKNDLLFARLSQFEIETDPMRDVRDIHLLDLSGLVANRFETTQFGPRLTRALVNSSTNYDRKRAAYVLKRFFCDDLTPIAVENPTVHAGGVHGSDPSCLACHYKLDPMAGFFKDLGFGFADFGKSTDIQFDDGASMDRLTYQAAWKAPAGGPREWNIGYIRSINQTALNDYGTSMDDLFAIIRKAPEARQCVVRRMFEYFVGEDRTLDQGYLESLTAGFNAAPSSSEGFKATLKQLLLSQSFAQTDPVAGQCYDTAPGFVAGGAPPCASAYLLQKNCTHCHNSTDEDFGRLDLSHWVLQPDGSYDFPYQDANGHQHTRKETFAKLMERIASPDPDLRMPKHTYISSSDLTQLNAWFLKASEPSSRRAPSPLFGNAQRTDPALD